MSDTLDASSVQDIDIWNRDDMEPRVREILDRTVRDRVKGPYAAKTEAQVVAMLENYFAVTESLEDIVISDVARMAGGASKEQFAFVLRHKGDAKGEKLVLRMDPLEAISQTCRGREAQVHVAFADVLPVASVRNVDADGDILGQPAIILAFVEGVTEPTQGTGHGFSGIGTRYDEWAAKLAPQFIDALAQVHRFDWRTADLSYYATPQPGTRQAAIWQINWWSQVWWDGVVQPVAMVTYAERWLRENAPVCDEPVMCHSDLRLGNFMFEEPSGKFTAVLDWELAHIGDFHEDIAWAIQRLFGTWRDDGTFLVCGLIARDEFLRAYEAASGNRIDPVKLRYYEVLNAYKCAVIDLGQAMRAATESNNHQDIILTWLGSAGAVFLEQLVTLIREA
ncbi:phosphotransferase family protein [Novosphingobium sp. B1]|uniref:phosphotransferase family protein n=1 Tax=Novosphingobium sp. B1 TaxID=1938756 RepID=UPI0009D7D4EC|nr:phosphotransferase family protein [Novosphingobium sp. B1]SMC94407.1 Predicted kinase, aminoglycoside phosphotransferase (APT) family [Novosphingobium sp. B1]